MRNKKVVRLTEGQLHNIIAESVKRVLKEGIEEGTFMNGVRNVVGRAYGAYQGAKTGYNHGAAMAKAANQHNNRVDNGADSASSHKQWDNDIDNNAVDAILNYIDKMDIYLNKDLIDALVSKAKQRRLYHKNSQEWDEEYGI